MQDKGIAMPQLENWYIVRLPEGNCAIFPEDSLNLEFAMREADVNTLEKWGPFESEVAAIARRVGLIRAGKCNPI